MAKITKNDLKNAAEAGGIEKMTLEQFQKLGGKTAVRGTVVKLDVGEAVGPVVITRILPGQILASEGKPVTVWCGNLHGDADKALRLPVSAIFQDQMASLEVQVGDTIAFARLDDVIKEKGLGKGKPMQNYTVQLLERGPNHG